jgi:ABC-type methionine transport system permease subunit
MHPQFREILAFLRTLPVKLTITSNGHSAAVLNDDELRAFHDIEFSLDDPTEGEQDAQRGSGNWALIHDQAARCVRLETPVTFISVMMKANYLRLVLNVLRSIPELVWVLICILAVGIGPFAGTIALGLHTAGVLGKLYAETREEVPMRPIEALRSLGARPLQVLFWAIWPQARPLLSSHTELRWEMNLRASTILGLVGGGRRGQAIYNNVQLGFYPRLSTLILLVYALVLTSDWIGEPLRLRVA